jgi:hypothetical protein
VADTLCRLWEVCTFPELAFYCHALRGGDLDHENHDMSETHETANADMQQAIPGLVADIAPFDYAQGRLRQGGRFSIFFTKTFTL